MDRIDGMILHDRPVSEATLKKLLLIFDRIYFLDPIENDFFIPGEVAKYKSGNNTIINAPLLPLYNRNEYFDLECDLIDKFDYAYDKGFIRIIDLRIRKFYEKNWLPLQLSYDFDTGNPQILNVLTPRIQKREGIESVNGLIRGGWVTFGSKDKFNLPKIPPVVNFFDEEENKKYQLNIQLYSTIGKINRALSVCSEFELIPIFINDVIASAFNEKFDSAKGNSELELNKKFQSYNGLELIKIQYLLYSITDSMISDDIINSIPIKELLIARNNTFHELYKLRRELIKDISFLTSTNFNDEFLKESHLYIKNSFEPKLHNYKKSFWNTFYKFLSISGGPILTSLTGSYLTHQGLSPDMIAYLSGSSAIFGGVSSELVSLVGNKKNKEFRNTFSYFLNFSD